MCIHQGAPQAILIGGRDDQVHMVRHQTVAPDFRLGLVRDFGQQVFVQDVITLFDSLRLRPIVLIPLCLIFGITPADPEFTTRRLVRLTGAGLTHRIIGTGRHRPARQQAAQLETSNTVNKQGMMVMRASL